MSLNKKQQHAFELMVSGVSVFLTGAAGTGKSHVVKAYYDHAVKTYGENCVAKTSSTGISAILIGGRTIHSFSGVFLGEGTVQEILKKMPISARENWRSVKVLFIDEISMIHPNLFDKLDSIAKIMKRNMLFPFGGIQVICIGDFYQLGPIPKDNIEKFCFEANAWNDLFVNTVTLTENMRQNDNIFQTLLNNMRYGSITDEDNAILESRIGVELKNDLGIEPTILFSKNMDVNYINNQRLQKLLENNDKFEYNSVYEVKLNMTSAKNSVLIEKMALLTKDLIPDNIVLTKYTQVVFKKNIRDTSIANGTRGIVVDFQQVDNKGDYYPRVMLLNGSMHLAIREEFEYETKGEFKLVKKQVPLKLAWATSVHAAQGSTIDYVKADIGHSIFAYGQCYTAISRVKSLEGLTLIDYTRSSIKAHPKVLAKYGKK
jgi:ATP-dependent DNA helicase PIF1